MRSSPTSISIWAAFTALSVDSAAKSLGRKPGPDNLEAVTLACYEDGKRISALDLLYSLSYGNSSGRSVGAFFENVDALVTPTIARPAAPLGELNQNKSGHERDGVDASGLRLLSVHAAVQLDRPARDFASSDMTPAGLPLACRSRDASATRRR